MPAAPAAAHAAIREIARGEDEQSGRRVTIGRIAAPDRVLVGREDALGLMRVGCEPIRPRLGERAPGVELIPMHDGIVRQFGRSRSSGRIVAWQDARMPSGASDLLDAYDDDLRGPSEMRGAVAWDTDGPILRGVFSEQRGFVSYRSLAGIEGRDLDALIERTIAHYRDGTQVRAFEWKTRGHDRPTDLAARLIAHGFEAEEVETVMIGAALSLVDAAPPPAQVTIRRIGTDDLARATADVERMLRMQASVFGRSAHDDAETFTRGLMRDPELNEAWIAEADGEVVCTGRLAIVPGTRFAGLWGGATRADWRLRGVYRALCAARARSAVAKGVHYLHSDSTEGSRPILERSGFTAVTTTTPYIWHRAPTASR